MYRKIFFDKKGIIKGSLAIEGGINVIERYEDWDDWKKTLGQAVAAGNSIGMGDEIIVKIGSKLGDILESIVEPENREQRVLKELWDVASGEEKKALTSMIVKMLKAEREIKT